MTEYYININIGFRFLELGSWPRCFLFINKFIRKLLVSQTRGCLIFLSPWAPWHSTVQRELAAAVSQVGEFASFQSAAETVPSLPPSSSGHLFLCSSLFRLEELKRQTSSDILTGGGLLQQSQLSFSMQLMHLALRLCDWTSAFVCVVRSLSVTSGFHLHSGVDCAWFAGRAKTEEIRECGAENPRYMNKHDQWTAYPDARIARSSCQSHH